MVSGEFCFIETEPDTRGRMSVLLHDWWTVHTNSRDVVNWDHYEAVTAGENYDPQPSG
ncbi:hypothetical protein [Arthrobacter sp. CAN_C5]|uniref:hypothetical protein n=1 Tax=Arthrobacter sp. CAN_C5 TaxID=2760706 RepID=UPI001AE2401B|nr:hypothetical protein [Arthrobacter sp. CAN_C5]MBP2215997.1 hypothetical protein [Arthrobacter sp. CAN_C5]